MNVTEIAKVAAENGKEPDWGRVMSEIPKVSKWMEKKIRLSCKLGFLIHFNLFLKILRKK